MVFLVLTIFFGWIVTNDEIKVSLIDYKNGTYCFLNDGENYHLGDSIGN